MSDITRILTQIEAGDPTAAEQLLPLIYDELRKLAAAKLSQEKPGQTLQATALVHEAYVRLVNDRDQPSWNSRGHFFAAAAEAMRRILVERARHKRRRKHGGEGQRLELSDEQAAKLVKLRYFAGLTLPDAAAAIDVSPRTADRLWAYAKAFLHQRLQA